MEGVPLLPPSFKGPGDHWLSQGHVTAPAPRAVGRIGLDTLISQPGPMFPTLPTSPEEESALARAAVREFPKGKPGRCYRKKGSGCWLAEQAVGALPGLAQRVERQSCGLNGSGFNPDQGHMPKL